jgi:hypothetical protein
MSTTRTANHAGIKISGAPRGSPVEWLNSFCPFALAKPMAPKSGSTRSLRVATASTQHKEAMNSWAAAFARSANNKH